MSNPPFPQSPFPQDIGARVAAARAAGHSDAEIREAAVSKYGADPLAFEDVRGDSGTRDAVTGAAPRLPANLASRALEARAAGVPAGEIDALLKSKFGVSLQQVLPSIGRGDAAAEGFMQGTTFGLSDEIEGAAHALVGEGAGNVGQRYYQQRDLARMRQEAARRDHGGFAAAGELAGTLVGPGSAAKWATRGLGRKALARVVDPEHSHAASKAMGLLRRSQEGADMAGRVGNVLRALPAGAGVGALYGAGKAREMENVPGDMLAGGAVGGLLAAPFTASSAAVPVGRFISGSPILKGLLQYGAAPYAGYRSIDAIFGGN